MNKKHIMDSFKEFSEEVAKLGAIKAKQDQRIKEHTSSFAMKAVAIVSGAVKKKIEEEQLKLKEIQREAKDVRGELMTKLVGFTGQIHSAPLKGSPGARSASAAPPVPEETQAQYAAAMTVAQDEENGMKVRCASALQAARIAGENMMLVSEALELCRDTVYLCYAEDEWPGWFRLPEAAVADLAAVTTVWGKKFSPIAEYAWEIVTLALESDDADDGGERANELPKWGRHQFLRLADESLTCVAQGCLTTPPPFSSPLPLSPLSPLALTPPLPALHPLQAHDQAREQGCMGGQH